MACTVALHLYENDLGCHGPGSDGDVANMEDWANAGCEGYLANPNMLRMGWGVDDISFLLMCECVDVSLVMQLGCLDPHMHAHVVAYTPRGWNSSCP
jgi:hypothetical protein